MTSDLTARVQPVPEERLFEANSIYAALAFVPSDPARDESFWIVENGAPTALGRINHHADGALEVGGFWVHPERRGQGLARELVGDVLGRLPRGRTCWCVPFDHLVDFYTSFGMQEPASSLAVPASVRGKLETCRESASRGELNATTLLVFTTGESPSP